MGAVVEFTPRPSQREILAYSGGRLGISAVPGSGKTHTLSALAAELIAAGRLGPNQEILIVTLVNSAVDNFSARMRTFAKSRDLIPDLGYRVRTLHGLAHDIVRENPPLIGLDKRFSIVDEAASAALVRDAARAWANAHADVRDSLVRDDLGQGQMRQLESRHWPDLIVSIAVDFIKAAKNERLTPEQLKASLDRQPEPLPLAQMGAEVYAAYQAALVYRGAVDFDDLIRLAADLLALSPELLERLRYRWPYILEDEAQDSSRLQEQILELLVGAGGNWVRVGDPNQAIFETFTTANPAFLRNFIRQNRGIDMPESGRCQPSIMRLANHLVSWTMNDHPVQALRDALSEPHIRPAPAGDPKPNPPDDPSAIFLHAAKVTPDEEVKLIARSVQAWLSRDKNRTVAVLTATNEHAASLVKELQARAIPCRELLRSTTPTRAVADDLSLVLSALADPGASKKAAQAYGVWRRDWRTEKNREGVLHQTTQALEKNKTLENYLSPASDALDVHGLMDEPAPTPSAAPLLTAAAREELRSELVEFRLILRRWHAAVVLPVDQLVLTIAQDVFTEARDLALAHKLALVMAQLANENPNWRLPELTPYLNEIARNERKFIGFSEDDSGFDPDAHKGVVVVATTHKAKGLEWDRVYLMSVNNYDFPAAVPSDSFIGEKWFLRDRLNLEEETLAQLAVARSASEFAEYVEGKATALARFAYARERLRLLYVALTRARKELVVTYNTGRRGDSDPALALVELQRWWDASSADLSQ